jgi:hypothetical protein
VEERRDVENHEREENATGISAQSGSHYAHPMAAASPAGRVGENPSHPTARVLPASGMDNIGDLTASSGHGGSASGNPTARRYADDSTGDRGAYFNPTADFWASENREGDLLTCGRRARVPPNWMQDYVTGEELSDPESNMAFIMSSDPFYFEDAVKITH